TQLLFIGLVVLVPFVLVMLQPDFGSGMVLFFVWLFAFVFLTKNKKHIFLIVGLIVLSLVASWFLVFKDYQKDRILAFANPSRDPSGSGYNVKQSTIAVGAGGLMGKGLGFGSQSQLKFIPESQTDFIFAVVAEELGLVGILFLMAFYLIVFWRLYLIAIRAPDDYAMFVAIMTASLIFIHLFINIGMCIGLLPVTGISLPFVSYGGSFLASMLILIGIINNIYRSSLMTKQGT
ncbi:MAG: FtsW/RodA/SpoVE family cell cycle protein, partial [Candidatus Buchananbacteria bacterium]